MHTHRTCWALMSVPNALSSSVRAARCGPAPSVVLQMHGYGPSAPAMALTRYTTRAHIFRSGPLLPTNVYLLDKAGGSCRKRG